MLRIVLAALCLRAGPDLACHYQKVNGKAALVVFRAQWEGIRKALYSLDRKTLNSLISEKNGVSAAIHWMFSKPLGNGRSKLAPEVVETKLTKARFLDIGKDDEYGMYGSGSVSTAVKGDTIYFKWLWVDLSDVENRRRPSNSGHVAYDARRGNCTWEMHGWTATKPGMPSSRIFFGSENGHLVIEKIEVSAEPD